MQFNCLHVDVRIDYFCMYVYICIFVDVSVYVRVCMCLCFSLPRFGEIKWMNIKNMHGPRTNANDNIQLIPRFTGKITELDRLKFLPRCMKCRRGVAMRILSVSLSVRLSVTRVIPDKMEERSVQIFIPYERIFILVFWKEEWLVGVDPFYVKFWVNRPPLERNRRFSTNKRS